MIIKHQHILSDDNCTSLYFDSDEVLALTIHKDEGCIPLFPDLIEAEVLFGEYVFKI